MKILYKTSAVSIGGRNGKVIVEGSPLAFEMASPEEISGIKKEGANPEQLFAAGYAACFSSALQHVLRVKKISIPLPVIRLTVGLGKNEAGLYALSADIVAVFHEIDPDTAETLVQEAHQICPYSNATRGNIDVTVSSRIES